VTIILHDDIPCFGDMAFEPARDLGDGQLVRLFARAHRIEVLTDDDAPTPPAIAALGRSLIACVRRGTVRQRYQEKRRAVRAFVDAFERHDGDAPAIALVLQPAGIAARTVALAVPLGALLEIRDALAGFSVNNDPKLEDPTLR
jgi:hypothetical protein